MSEEKNNEEVEKILDIESEEEHDCSCCPGCCPGCFHGEEDEEE